MGMLAPACAVLFSLLASVPAYAAQTVRIGVIYPLTGNAASAGASAKDAVELGVEVVNNAHPELAALPLAATTGLPNLGAPRSSWLMWTTRETRRSGRIRRCA